MDMTDRKKDSDNNLISIKDTIYLNPIEKYKYYGKFPWKFIIHLLLLVGTSAQALLIICATTEYTRSQERIFYDNFLSEVDKNELDVDRIVSFYTLDDIKKSVNDSIENFYSLQEKSIEELEYIEDNPHVEMEIEYLKSFLNEENRFEYLLNQTYKGPFDLKDDELKVFLRNIIAFQVKFSFKTFVPLSNIKAYECYLWSITQNYSFRKRSHFILNLDIKRSTCDCSNERIKVSSFSLFINKLLWIHIVVIILAAISLILTWKYVYKMAKFFWKVKDKLKALPVDTMEEREKLNNIYTSRQSKWDIVKSTDKGKLFNKWSIICLLGNIVQVFGTALSFVNHNETMQTSEGLIGFGCMLAYVNMGRYIDYNKGYSTIYSTISKAIPVVLRYVLGVLPILFGFMFFGLCLFWKSENFESTSSSLITLFSIMNGDSVLDIFTNVTGISFFLGQIFCYVFCLIFIV